MKPIIAVPATAALVYRAWSRKSLTPLGIAVAFITAVVHALHPWSAPFALLVIFFIGGTTATKVKHDIKANLTLSSTGSTGGEGARTHVQVLANSVVASILIAIQLSLTGFDLKCLPVGGTTLVLTAGIVAQYAAVAADTFSSELGILSKTKPRLITNFKTVPPGTNGGVTTAGLLAGALGAFTIAITSVLLVPFCTGNPGPVGRVLMSGEKRGWVFTDKIIWVIAVTLWGALGSVLDSLLGATLQASVVDKRTGKVVEGIGGTKVRIPDLFSYFES
ncbi:hypothetical protein UCRPC4_g01074 [Phaeomoniella chlamydospora]|uniref:Duf92 domain protein n=1 Tax=Phaeomoniella chlamydospora TaxID=158046 RepID=A0A0G2EZD1_PHACM|nr:hypothetical protein UCRPC4_g01074 [Phaeomoniella chlamydospora]